MHWSLVLSLTTTLAAGVAESGTHHASIKSKYGQLVTSSTLRWAPMSSGESLPKEAVPSGTGNAEKFVCRAEHHGALLVGQTTEVGSYCLVGFVSKLYKKHNYELLINVDRAARLEWRPYSKYAGVPEGGVAAVDESSSFVVGDNDVFIGRHLSAATTSWLPGAVEVPRRSSSFGLMRVFDPRGVMSEESSGDILVEIEPVRYELEVHSPAEDEPPHRAKKILRSDVVLAKSSLFRFDEGKDVEARMQKVLSYEYEKSEYYGQVPGMIRALPASIRLPNGQVQSVLWGLPEKSHQRETIMVGHALKHFRAVDVSVVGVRITEEKPYRAALTAVFPDGTRRQRPIDGVLQSIYLDNIRPEYSRIYHIKESKDSPTSMTTTEHSTKEDSFQIESRRHNDLFGDEGRKRQTKESMLSDRAASGGLDQQQLLMASASSSATSCSHTKLFSPIQELLVMFTLLLHHVLLLRRAN